MWDCKHRNTKDDSCRRRKAKCYPGGVACVLKDKFEFPLRKEDDPLLKRKKSKSSSSKTR